MAQANGNGCLYECLQEAHLERYHAHFVRHGISKCDELANLSMQDYSRFGITRMEDRVRLFKLVQIVKSVQSEGKYCKHDNRNIQDNPQTQYQRQHSQDGNDGERSRGQAFLQYVRSRPTVRPSDIGPSHNMQPNPFAGISAGSQSVMAPTKKKPARDSEVGIRYRPGTGSPIFNCRKILTFSDSEDEIDEEKEEDILSPDTNSITDSEIRQKVLATMNEGTHQGWEQGQSIGAYQYALQESKKSNQEQVLHNPIRVTVPPPKSFYVNLHNSNSEKQEMKGSVNESKRSPQENLFGHPNNRDVMRLPPKTEVNNPYSEEREMNPNQRKRIMHHEDIDFGNISGELLAKKKTAQSKSRNNDNPINIHSEEDEDVDTDEFFAIPVPAGILLDHSMESPSKITSDANTQTPPESSQMFPNQPLKVIKLGVQTQSVEIVSNLHQKISKSSEYNPAKYSPKPKKVMSRLRPQPQVQPEEVKTHFREEDNQKKSSPVAVPVTAHIAASKPLPKSAMLREARSRAISEVAVHAYFPNSQTPTSPKKEPVVERVMHTKEYNYGVPSKPDTPSRHRSGGSRNSSVNQRIKVCVRKRPLTRREQKRQEVDIATVDGSDTIIVDETKVAVDLAKYIQQHVFVFDEVFSENHSNIDVYASTAKPLVRHIFNKGSATCFAFGQTGAGKTYTLLGTQSMPGLYRLAAADMFIYLQNGEFGHNLHLWVSYYEIYCSQLYDLLNKRKKLHVRENGRQRVCIAGLMETRVRNVDDVAQVVQYGNTVRSTGSTGVNPNSSRSHAILQLEVRDSRDQRLGRLSFIDLAGSERATDVTEFDRQTRIEGAEINQSLLAALQTLAKQEYQLKECIRSLDQDSKHTPYRQSKLTHILRDSFIGNSRTCMIANISPSLSACENSLNTLRYADRVKELRASGNFAMNTPATASETQAARGFNPAVFHPSNIQFSSTPKQDDVGKQSAPELNKAFQEDYESPIRGHKIRRPGELPKAFSPQKPTKETPSPKKRSPGFEFTLERQGRMVNISASRGSESRSSLEAVRRGRSDSSGSLHSVGMYGSARKQSPQGESLKANSTPRSTHRSGRKKSAVSNSRPSLQLSPQNNENSHSGGEPRSRNRPHTRGRSSERQSREESPYKLYSSSSPQKVPSIKDKLMTLADNDTFDVNTRGNNASGRSAPGAPASSSARGHNNDPHKGSRTRASFIEDHRQILSHLDNIMDRAKAAIEMSSSSEEQSPQRPYSARTPRASDIDYPSSPDRAMSAERAMYSRTQSNPGGNPLACERQAPIRAFTIPTGQSHLEGGIQHNGNMRVNHNEVLRHGSNGPHAVEERTFRPLEDRELLDDARLEQERVKSQESQMPDGHHFSPSREDEEGNEGQLQSLDIPSEFDTTLSADESDVDDTSDDSEDLENIAHQGDGYCLCENNKREVLLYRDEPREDDKTSVVNLVSGKAPAPDVLVQKMPDNVADGHVPQDSEQRRSTPTETRLIPRPDVVRESGPSTNSTPFTSLHHSNHDISKQVANIRSLLSFDNSEHSIVTENSPVPTKQIENSQQRPFIRSASMPEQQESASVSNSFAKKTSSDFLKSLADIKIGRPAESTRKEEDQESRLMQVNPALARLSKTFKTPESLTHPDLLASSAENASRPFQPYHRASVSQYETASQDEGTHKAKPSVSLSSETHARDITDSGIDTQRSLKLSIQEEDPEPVSTASTLDGIISLSVNQEENTRWEAIRTHQKKLEQVVRQQSMQQMFDSDNLSGSKQSSTFIPIHPYPATHMESQIFTPRSVHMRGSDEVNMSDNSGPNDYKSAMDSSKEERILTGTSSVTDIHKGPGKPMDAHGLNEDSGTPRSNASTSSSKSSGSAVMRAQVAGNEKQNRIRQLVLAAHEEQLAEITALCKQEMKLLVAVKSGEQTFEEYVQNLEQLLSSKAATISTLRAQVAEFANHPVLKSACNTPR